jgi:membrane protease YdiL (CAAX protease family)
MSSISEPVKHSPSVSILFHLLPGLILTLVFTVSAYIFRDLGIPAYFFLELSVLLFLLPYVVVFLRAKVKDEGVKNMLELFPYRQKLPWWEYLVWIIACMAIMILVFMTIGKVLDPLIKEYFFSRLPAYLDVTDIARNPTHYSQAWILTVWILGIFTTTLIGPFIEELYFRAYLFPRIKSRPILMILFGALLFSAYHLFSPWMLVTRFIALLPLYFIVWRRRNFWLGVYAHCLLNFFGDTISMIPLVFK